MSGPVGLLLQRTVTFYVTSPRDCGDFPTSRGPDRRTT